MATCLVCLEEGSKNSLLQLPCCGQMLHASCYRKWLSVRQGCPVCRPDAASMLRVRSEISLFLGEQAPVCKIS